MNVSLRFGSLVVIVSLSARSRAEEACCTPAAPLVAEVRAIDNGPSWIFRRSTYTHDPYTGARVAQYMRTPPVEPLDDERAVTSRYHRTRTTLRGADGSAETYYEVQSWGNGGGALDAEWERFHDAWKESYLQGGYYNQGPQIGPAWGYGVPGGGFGPGPQHGYGYPGYGSPGYGGHGYGGSGYGGSGYGGPGYSGP